MREQILRLLREDEEFRALVLAYLGLAELFSRIDKLVESIDELRRVTELQGERLDRHEQRISELIRALEELRRVTELQGERLDRHEQRISELTRAVEELRKVAELQGERLARHEQRISELTKAVEELRRVTELQGERLDRLERAVEKLVEVSERHERRLSRLERDVRAIRRSLDRISISLEEEANDMVTYFLRQKGYELETRPTRFDARYEFDIYGTDGRITVIGEAKVRAGSKSIEKLCKRVERVRQLWPEKFPGEVILVLYCMRAEPGAVEAAEREGIWLLESMKEKVPLKL